MMPISLRMLSVRIKMNQTPLFIPPLLLYFGEPVVK